MKYLLICVMVVMGTGFTTYPLNDSESVVTGIDFSGDCGTGFPQITWEWNNSIMAIHPNVQVITSPADQQINIRFIPGDTLRRKNAPPWFEDRGQPRLEIEVNGKKYYVELRGE